VSAPTKFPRTVVAGLVLAVVLDTVMQIVWKLSVAHVPAGASLGAAVCAVLTTPLFYVAMLALVAQLWNWLRVLAHADLSFAQPITALSYITVIAISCGWLHEKISLTKVIGVALIFVGVFCISRTPFRTVEQADSVRP
jgi:drug/metabolite transporter (DMT)-like permease